MITLLRGFFLLAATLATTEPALAQGGQAERGHAFAQAHCARCHAVGRRGESPFAAAPPFRELHKRYPLEQLSEAFAEGITTGHRAMPEFELDPRRIDDLIAYMRSLGTR